MHTIIPQCLAQAVTYCNHVHGIACMYCLNCVFHATMQYDEIEKQNKWVEVKKQMSKNFGRGLQLVKLRPHSPSC